MNKTTVSIASDFIYHIQVGKFLYVGQSSQPNDTRFQQHIRNAYYNHQPEPLYDKMRRHKIQDIAITYYTAPNYGIPDFQAKYLSFQKEWVPTNGSILQPLDFAEIYHILGYGCQRNIPMLNTEIGGRHVKSFTYAGLTNNTSRAIITAQTPLKTAYQIMKKGALSFAQVQDLTYELYKMMFDANGPNNIKTSPLYPTWTKVNPLPSSARIAGKDYLSNKLIPWLLNNIQITTSKNLLTIQNDIVQQASMKIEQEFLNPRQSGIKNEIVKYYNEIANSKIMFDEGNLDLQPLGEYLSKPLIGLVGQVFNRKTGDLKIDGKNSSTIQSITNHIGSIVPIRISTIGNAQGIKSTSGIKNGLCDEPIDPQQLSTEGYQRRSLLLFDHLFKLSGRSSGFSGLAGKRHIIPYKTHKNSKSAKSVISQTLQADIVRVSDVVHDDTLSVAIRDWYQKFAPAYLKDGGQFYRPMVSAGRYYRKHEQFSGLSSLLNHRTYFFYQQPILNAFMVYKSKGFDIISHYQDLKIY